MGHEHAPWIGEGGYTDDRRALAEIRRWLTFMLRDQRRLRR